MLLRSTERKPVAGKICENFSPHQCTTLCEVLEGVRVQCFVLKGGGVNEEEGTCVTVLVDNLLGGNPIKRKLISGLGVSKL